MSNNNKMPEGWGQNKSVPDSWKKGNELPENWGKQSAGNRVMGTSSTAETNQAPASNINISDVANKGAGLLAGAAKKIGGAAKNAAENAVEYAKSDDAREKLDAAKVKIDTAKNKAQALVGSAGAAMSDMKDKAASYAAEHKTAVENSTEAEYQEVPDYVASQEEHDRSVDEMIEEALAASGESPEGAEYDTVPEEQTVVDNTPVNAVSEPVTDQPPVQNDRYYEQPVNQPPVQNAGDYEQPVGDQMQLYGYKEKKSPVVYVMAGIIAVLLVGGGILGGMLLMKDNGDKPEHTTTSASEVNNKNTDESISAENTSIDEADEEIAAPDPLDDAAISIYKAANSALCEMDEKYGIPSESIILFSSDSKYRFYFNNSIDQHEEEFEDLMRMYCSDIDELNYIVETNEYQCISVVVEGPDGKIGRYPSDGREDALFIPNSSGTFKEIADQALANAQKYMEEHPAPVVTGNKLKFYSSDKINDYPAYLEKLKDMQNTGMYRDQNNGFFLCDINEDDTPELFVTFNTEEPDLLFAGSVYSGELVTFAEFTGAGMLRGITLFDNGAIGITSGGNEGHGMSYKYYSGGNSFSDQNNNDESISYIYENGSLSYISYQNGGQEKHISEAEAEQVQQKYVEAVYTAAPVSSVIKTEAAKPVISATIEEVSNSPQGNGSTFYLNTSGDYAYYHYECYYSGGGDSNQKCASGDTSESRIYVTGGSVLYEVWATVTPYNSNGIAGEPISVKWERKNTSTVINGVTVYDCSKYGRINTRGGTLPSVTLDYITGGEWQTLRDSLGNDWHIKATRYCNTMGITWYEIEDADDGEYYGWIDGSFINFD